MGEPLGQRNASKATSRHVKEHDYRLCLSVGAQYGHAGVIFSDASGGSPQRFYWWPGTDPNMPEGTGEDPDPLDTAAPKWGYSGNGVAEIKYDDPEIAKTIRTNDLARNRGEGDALDGHALLARCKLAALLAIMHQRQNVTARDWELSGMAMQVSDDTRNAMLEYDRQAARSKLRERAMARARGEEFVSDHKLSRAKAAVLRWLQRDGELAANQLRSKLKADLRDHFGAAVAELAAEGFIVEIHVDRGARYRLDPQVQGVLEVQGHYSQVSEGVPQVQGVPAGNVTDLDTRRSTHTDSPRPTRTALSFILAYLNAHAGTDGWVAVSQVRAAGAAEGHQWDALHRARKTSTTPRIATSRTGPNSSWRIERAEETA